MLKLTHQNSLCTEYYHLRKNRDTGRRNVSSSAAFLGPRFDWQQVVVDAEATLDGVEQVRRVVDDGGEQLVEVGLLLPRLNDGVLERLQHLILSITERAFRTASQNYTARIYSRILFSNTVLDQNSIWHNALVQNHTPHHRVPL